MIFWGRREAPGNKAEKFAKSLEEFVEKFTSNFPKIRQTKRKTSAQIHSAKPRDQALASTWAELGGGKTYRRAKPETIFGDPPKKISEGGHLREILGISKGLSKRNGMGGGGTYRGEGGGGQKLFSVGSLLVKVPPSLLPPPLFGVLCHFHACAVSVFIFPIS